MKSDRKAQEVRPNMKNRKQELAGIGVRKRLVWIAGLLVLLVSFWPAIATAEEPSEAFLNALRDRGYFEEALLYLEHSASSEIVSADFKKTIPYEKALILIDSIQQVRDPALQETRLDQADTLLAQYAASVSDPVKATDVLNRQSRVKYLRGSNYLVQSNSKLATGDKKKELIGKARNMLGGAVTQYQKVKTSQADQIQNFLIDPEDPNSNDNLAALRASYVRNRLRIPQVMEKYALTFDEASAERKAEMAKAAAEFESVAKAYDQKFGEGRMARAFAARCFQQSGEIGKSGAALKEVFDYPAPSRLLQRVGLMVGVNTWPKMEKYPADTVIRAAETPLGLLDRREKQTPDWMRIQMELARAKRIKSGQVEAEDPAVSRKLATEASRLAREVARSRTPHSEAAAKLLGEWGVSIKAAAAQPVAVEPPKNFAEAKDRGKTMVAELEDGLREITKLEREVGRTAEGAEKDTMVQELQDVRDEVNSQADQALAIFSASLELAPPDTPRVDLNNIRYLQAYCYFAKRRYEESAVIGRFLLRKYPTIDWSQQAAGLMVRSYEKLYDAADPADKASLYSQVADGASMVMDRWPDGSGAGSAAVSATKVAVLQNDYATANRFFDRIGTDSTARSPLASRLGQKIWSSRRKATSDEQKNQMTEQARNFLDIAVDGKDLAAMNFTSAVSALYLIDANRELGDIDAAVSQIESLLGAIETNQALGANARFRQSAHNAAVNTYLEAMRSKSNKQPWIKKANGVISKMSSEAAGDPVAQKMLTGIYKKIAGDLQDQFEALNSLPEKQNFADSLMSFFGDVGSVATDAKTRLWAGSTLLGISESLAIDGGTEKAKEVSTQAIASLEAARQVGFADNPELELNYQHQLALALRGSGQYEKAVASFQKLLEKSNGINFQIDGAKTLYMWGVNEKEATALAKAVNGTGKYRDPKTKKEKKRIWGWSTIVSLTRKDAKYRPIFREALYYKVLCRFQYGQIKNDKASAKSALKELENALKRFDDLKVEPWTQKYDQLHLKLKQAVK